MSNYTESNKNQIEIGDDKDKYLSLETKKLDIDAGCLGKFFGSSLNAPSNIAGLTIIFLLGISIYGTICPTEKLSATDIWKVTSPIITMILGYLFGKSSGSNT